LNRWPPSEQTLHALCQPRTRPPGRGERRPHRLARNRQARATRLPTAARLPHYPL